MRIWRYRFVFHVNDSAIAKKIISEGRVPRFDKEQLLLDKIYAVGPISYLTHTYKMSIINLLITFILKYVYIIRLTLFNVTKIV